MQLNKILQIKVDYNYPAKKKAQSIKGCLACNQTFTLCTRLRVQVSIHTSMYACRPFNVRLSPHILIRRILYSTTM